MINEVPLLGAHLINTLCLEIIKDFCHNGCHL